MKKLLPLLVVGLVVLSGCSWLQQAAPEDTSEAISDEEIQSIKDTIEENEAVNDEDSLMEDDSVENDEVENDDVVEAAADSDSPEVALAKCITESGAKLYTASWCGHCKNQKEAFGDALEFLDNTECAEGDGWAQACTDAGVKAVPTWIFGDGTSKSGNTPLATLAELTGCEYNN